MGNIRNLKSRSPGGNKCRRLFGKKKKKTPATKPSIAPSKDSIPASTSTREDNMTIDSGDESESHTDYYTCDEEESDGSAEEEVDDDEQPEQVIQSEKLIVDKGILRQILTTVKQHTCRDVPDITYSLKAGLDWQIHLKCPACESTFQYCATKNVSEGAVLGSINAGIGARPLNMLMAAMELSTMRPSTFGSIQETIGETIEKGFEKSTFTTHQQEIEFAHNNGQFFRGLPYIRVMVDGGWGKRSLGHSYNSSTGVVVVIGEHTKQVLQVIPKNKRCAACDNGNTSHRCVRNHAGSSGSMESEGVVEAFNKAPTEYNCYYLEYVADGDSSTADAIVSYVTYGPYVKKISCSNHVVKNMRKELEAYRLKPKTSLSQHDIRRISYSVRETIRRYAGQRSECLKSIRNVIHHVGGDHRRCPPDFCRKTELPPAPLPWPEDTVQKIQKVLDKVANTSTIELDKTNNPCEQYMNTRSAMDGHKGVDRGKGRAWNTICYAAALRTNLGNTWPRVAMEQTQSSIRYYNKLDQEITRNRERSRRRDTKVQRKDKRLRRNAQNTKQKEDYGKGSALDQELPLQELVVKMRERYQDITKKTPCGKQGELAWRAERRERLTSSNFGRISKRRKTTKPPNIVKSILYSSFVGNVATQYGIDAEAASEEDYIRYITNRGVTEITIKHPGLIAIPGTPELAASPDGVVYCSPGDSGLPQEYLVEYKNPKTLIDQNLTVDEAIDTVAGFPLLKTDEGYILKEKHDFFYQVQGAMMATNTVLCHLVIRGYNSSMAVASVKLNIQFWQTIRKNLQDFYFHAILPELAHPLYRFNHCLRPEYVVYDTKLLFDEA